MTKSCSRRIVVLRDIPSNFIEEAILVLKSDNTQNDKGNAVKNKIGQKRDFIVLKEAEMIIDNFLNNEKNFSNKISPNHKLSRRLITDILINSGLIMGISLVIYLVCKAF